MKVEAVVEVEVGLRGNVDEVLGHGVVPINTETTKSVGEPTSSVIGTWHCKVSELTWRGAMFVAIRRCLQQNESRQQNLTEMGAGVERLGDYTIVMSCMVRDTQLKGLRLSRIR